MGTGEDKVPDQLPSHEMAHAQQVQAPPQACQRSMLDYITGNNSSKMVRRNEYDVLANKSSPNSLPANMGAPQYAAMEPMRVGFGRETTGVSDASTHFTQASHELSFQQRSGYSNNTNAASSNPSYSSRSMASPVFNPMQQCGNQSPNGYAGQMGQERSMVLEQVLANQQRNASAMQANANANTNWFASSPMSVAPAARPLSQPWQALQQPRSVRGALQSTGSVPIGYSQGAAVADDHLSTISKSTMALREELAALSPGTFQPPGLAIPGLTSLVQQSLDQLGSSAAANPEVPQHPKAPTVSRGQQQQQRPSDSVWL